MRKPIEELRLEHKAILDTVQVLEDICFLLRSEAEIIPEDLVYLTDLLRRFADTCHHGKEEKFLFPVLLTNGTKEADAILNKALSDHHNGRKQLEAMRLAVSHDPVDTITFIENSEGLIEFYRDHIQSEETVVYPAIERLLSPESGDEIARRMESYEHHVMGKRKEEEHRKLINYFQEKYRSVP